MPTTTPFQSGILSKIKARQQAARYSAVLSDVRQFRAYCCNIDSDGIMGVAKEPVPFLSITPNPVCLGHSITWDLDGSYAPGSTLTSWSVDFGDNSPGASGADFPNDTTSGTYTYAAIGTYTITVEVFEGTGLSQEIEAEAEVVECGEIGILGGTYTYLSLDGGGVYFIDWNDVSPDWEAKNFGLTGEALNVKDLEIHPKTKHLAEGSHELWIATQGGVYRTKNGGDTWEQIPLPAPDNSYFSIMPEPTTDDLMFHKVVFHPLSDDSVFILASGDL